LCRILQIDEIYVKSCFVNNFLKGVQILHKINVMRYMYIYENNPFMNDCANISEEFSSE
jgi:hypothetical protein